MPKKLVAPLLMFLMITGANVLQVQALERFEIVTTQELETMLGRRQAGELDFLLVNTLDEIIFQYNAIPGSISLPWSRVTELKDRLGSDADKLIITYCMGYR